MVPQQAPKRRRRWTNACLVFIGLFFVVGAGCAPKAPNFVPTKDAARQALDAALTAWVNGKSVGLIDSASPPVQVVDNGWWKGQRLASYEVLGEEPGKDGLYCYSVRLHLSKPQTEQTVRYLVTGKSPLWVYREEDYKSSQSWEGYK
jgi:hypothetical protein